MARNNLLALVFFLLGLGSQAQIDENRYLVFFTDKDNTPFSIAQPSEFLSSRAIERRANQNIPITEQDLPVDPAYIAQVQALGEVEVLNSLKWFNAILIETDDPAVLESLEAMNSVERVEVSPYEEPGPYPEVSPIHNVGSKNDFTYGPSLNQIDMLNGLALHDEGFLGEEKWIGVFDGGFALAENAAALDSLFIENRIIATRNFVNGTDEVFQLSFHGSYVLSAMASILPDSIIGTAPRASYVLCITEDVSQERRIEEAWWAAAAEYADSLGIDIINSSLGYSTFDLDAENYTYAMLDGNTALITRAADIAASKGILVVSSAGNLGNSPFYYFSAPADGDSVLAVGAVRPNGQIAAFSSRGPRVDGAVKPNVVAQGQSTILSNLFGGVTQANGTSFSAPLISGMAACLWSAVPEATNMQVFQAIQESAHLYENPNDSLGYGIPDFGLALQNLSITVGVENQIQESNNQLRIFPNPYHGGALHFSIPEHFLENAAIRFIDLSGRVVAQQNISGNEILLDETFILSNGIYILSVTLSSGETFRGKLVVRKF